jgi:Na+-translocating ferredoxin:NAD+ oxidoreductase RnfA subunit
MNVNITVVTGVLSGFGYAIALVMRAELRWKLKRRSVNVSFRQFHMSLLYLSS